MITSFSIKLPNWFVVPSMITLAIAPALHAQTWIGAAGTPGLWSEPTNWDTGIVPTASSATISNGGIATINSVVSSITTLDVAAGAGSVGGTLEIKDGGSLTVTDSGSDGFRIGIQNSGVGAQGFLNQSGGILNHLAGETRIGLGAGSQGVFNLSGGTANLENVRIGVNAGSHGVVNQTGGTFNSATSEFYIAQNGTGEYNISGDTSVLNVSGNRLELGRGNGSVATFNQAGGTVKLGNRLDLGDGDNTALATYNISGGLLDMTTTNSDSRILVGAFNGNNPTGAVGVFNQTGGLVQVQQLVATENTGTTGTINLNGGVMATSQIHTGNGTGFLNFDGGTAKATGGGDFIYGTFTEVNIKAGGATIDSNDQVINIVPAVNGVGKLTKIGGQALTLVAATNGYSGGTLVSAGGLVGTSFGTGDIEVGDGASITLTANTAIGNNARVTLDGTGSIMNLNFSGTETVGSLFVDGTFLEIGTYTAAELIADFGTHFTTSTSDAVLNVTAVPEPSVWALIGSGLFVMIFAIRRRRVS